MKRLILSIAFASTIMGANEPSTHLSPLPLKFRLPTAESSCLIGFSTGLATGGACALVDHYTNDTLWILTWMSIPTLRHLIMNSCYESYKTPTLSLKEKNKLKKRKKISSLVGEITAWVMYIVIKNGLKPAKTV